MSEEAPSVAPLTVDSRDARGVAAEAERIRVLREHEVLDTPNERAFDDIAELAALVCGTPTALVTFVDAQRQWFKSRIGMALRETHRNLSFCSHAILGRHVMVVPDATRDPRFADNALVIGPPYIRFYAGAPVVVEGHGLGTVAVVDYAPRQLSALERGGLRALRRQVTAQLDLRRRAIAQSRVAAEATSSLRRTTDHRSAMLDSALDAIVGMDASGRVTEFNPAAQRMFGYRRSEAVGASLAELIIPTALREAHARGLDRYLASGESVLLGRRIEINAVRSDGTEFPVELSVQRVGETEPPLFTGFIRDITGRRLLEAQLRQSQKLEAVGQLAGGVAHDFNNVLTVINAHASLLLNSEGGEGEVQVSARQIADAAERAARLTRQLLAFSRRQVMDFTEVDLHELVGNMAPMLKMLGEHIDLRVDAAPGLPPVRADVTMVEQVVLNLAVNARDAMPTGGEFRIKLAAEHIDEAFVRDNPEAVPGRYVRLTVSDSGSGIPSEVLPHIFEPFFTTKDVDRGSGLGLATVYGIIKQHRGWITARSEPGQGATFDVYFPACEEAQAPHAVVRDGPVRRGDETVLLVEDEAGVREVARRILETSGYTVLEAVSGANALEVWETHRDRVDLVLTDMVMPGGITGLDLAKRVLQGRPRTRVIVTSGYSVAVSDEGLDQSEGLRFLQKPYSLDGLLKAVRASLDST